MRGKGSFWLLVGILLVCVLMPPYVLVPMLASASPDAKILVSPAVIMNTSATPGNTFSVGVNVSDIPSPGLFAYEYYMKWSPVSFLSQPKRPLVNPNFTDTGSSAWTTTTSITRGTAASGYDSTDGNPNMTMLYLSSTSDGFGTDYRALSASGGTEDITTTIKHGTLANRFYYDPFTTNSTVTGTPSDTALSGYGWRSDGQYNRVIPTGKWTFYVTLTPTHTGTGHIEIYVYKCDSDGANVAKLFSIDATGTNVLATAAKNRFAFTYLATSSYDLTGKVLVIDYWLHVTVATASADAQTKLSTVSAASLVLIPHTAQAASYYVKATAPAGDTALMTFYTDQIFTFNWKNQTPPIPPISLYYSFAYRITGNSIGSAQTCYIYIRLRKPDSTFTQFKSIALTAATGWVYLPVETGGESAFAQNGTYWMRLMAILKTVGTGTDKWVQVNYDDVQWRIVPLNVKEGQFLKNGGSTYMTSKYFDQGYIYVSNTLTGTPYSNAFPQTGNGTLATVTFYVEGYNETALDLYDTILLTLGPPPGYPAVPIEHTAEDGYFANIAGIVHDVAVINLAVGPSNAWDGQDVSINATVENQGTKTESFTVSTYYDSNLIQTQSVTNLAGNTSTTRYYTWDTAGVAPGTYTIKAVASTIPGETDTADNTLVDSTVTVSYTHNVAVLSVTPSNTSIYLNETITITVVVKNKGIVAETFNVTAYYAATPIETKTVTNLAAGENQTLNYTWDTTGLSAGSYTVKATATTVAGEIYTADNTFIDGSVQISVRLDVAVISVSVSKTNVLQGQFVNITVVVKNKEQSQDSVSFDVYARYDETSVGSSQTVTDLAIGANTTLIFTWNTSSVARKKYTIKASAELAADPYQSDNTKTDGTVRIIAEANGDGVVDVIDLALLGQAWQTESGQDPNYDAAVDFNEDGFVNVSDFALLGESWGYGKEWT